MTGFGFRDMILSGWPVLSILLIMSVISVTVIWDRVVAFRRARLDARAFFANVIRMLTEQGVEQAYDYAGQFAKPAALIARRILAQPGGREARERAAQNALQTQVNELERYVAVLGTIGSTAPFIGLFGTVMGIIKAFQDIALNAGGGPEVVSVGIAEALITTAFGLLVAIPAVIGYNYCVRQIQRLAQDIDVAAFDLLEKLTGEAE
ncbi:MAG: MotA/TolQ/ExbB proton channel family protein [Lentisphaerae bacterium]|nr:MotA/TolQ/ExbB proton channel family protein [Lentisphaerota bacterium]